MVPLSRWPRETLYPGLSLGAASDKGGSGLSGRTGSAPGLSGDLEPGVRLRALHGAQPSPAPTALKAKQTPRAPGSCPWCRRAGEARGARLPNLVSRNREGSGARGQRVGPAAGLLQQELGAQAHRPPKERLRGTDWRPRGRPGAVPALLCQEKSGPFD